MAEGKIAYSRAGRVFKSATSFPVLWRDLLLCEHIVNRLAVRVYFDRRRKRNSRRDKYGNMP